MYKFVSIYMGNKLIHKLLYLGIKAKFKRNKGNFLYIYSKEINSNYTVRY